MKSRIEITEIIKQDIRLRNEEVIGVSSPEDLRFEASVKVGDNSGEIDDIYVGWYLIPWGIDVERIFVDVSAKTGKIYQRIGPASYTG